MRVETHTFTVKQWPTKNRATVDHRTLDESVGQLAMPSAMVLESRLRGELLLTAPKPLDLPALQNGDTV